MRLTKCRYGICTHQLRYFWISLCVLSCAVLNAQVVATDTTAVSSPADSLNIHRGDTLMLDHLTGGGAPVDALGAYPKDSLLTDTLEKPKKQSFLEAQVVYSATDSIVLWGNGTAFLHGAGDVTYQTMNLKADYVRVKMDSSLIYAKGVRDSVGDLKGNPVFSDNGTSYESKEMTYNLKTRKGFIRHVVTQQGEGYIVSDRTKITDDKTLSMAGGKYTTCDDHEHPHFYLQLTKAKVKPGEYVASGPAYLVLADVPLPLAVPFGFFPFTNTYSSGVIMPTFGDDANRGFYLQNGGYYFAINDYFDLQLTGDIYTKGTWALNLQSSYVKRYKFRGSLSIAYRNDVTSEKDLPDYQKATNMSIRWSHSQDAKANPYSTFSANVNFSTSGYNRSNINSYYDGALNSENTKSSSVSFSQRFPESPWSISGSVSVAQRTRDSTINLSLPTLNISMSRIYPFKRKNPIGKERWYEKISLSYTATINNSIDTKESKLFKSSFLNDWKNGIKHSVPITASFMLFKYINISPRINYNSRMYFRRVDQSWDEQENQVHRDTTNGFYYVQDFNVGVSASTKLYGFYIPVRKIFGDKIDRIRHVLTPSVGVTWHPDFGAPFWGYYGSYQRPINPNDPEDLRTREVTYSRFEGALYGTPARGQAGTVDMSLGNNLEMKIRNDKDTTGNQPYKVISLIDNFTLSTAYNMAADSMRWSNFNAQLRLKLWKGYTLSLSGSFDPYRYALNEFGNPVHISKWRKFPKFMGTSTSFSYTFNNNTFKTWFGKGKKKQTTSEEEDISPDLMTENGELETKKEPVKMETRDDGYQKVEIPWSLSVNYTIRYGQSGEFNKEKMDYKMEFTHNLSLNGNISMGKWRVSASTSYDFEAKKFTYTNFTVNRDLHCWSMSGTFVPFGPYKSYTFRIGVNASMLSDLKYEKQSDYGRPQTNWW